jgi:hypothetical protein
VVGFSVGNARFAGWLAFRTGFLGAALTAFLAIFCLEVAFFATTGFLRAAFRFGALRFAAGFFLASLAVVFLLAEVFDFAGLVFFLAVFFLAAITAVYQRRAPPAHELGDIENPQLRLSHVLFQFRIVARHFFSGDLACAQSPGSP